MKTLGGEPRRKEIRWEVDQAGCLAEEVPGPRAGLLLAPP